MGIHLIYFVTVVIHHKISKSKCQEKRKKMESASVQIDQVKSEPKYATRLREALIKYENIFLVEMDFVTSNQLHQIRMDLRGDAEIIMGTNVKFSHHSHFKGGNERYYSRSENFCNAPIYKRKRWDYCHKL
jgi:hypothetical protein